MRVLLDESIPTVLASRLVDHRVRTVAQLGWAGKKNGELLRLADATFDAFVTMDRSLPQQQNLTGLRLGIVILIARSNDIADLEPLVPKLLSTLPHVRPGGVVRIAA